jgi:DNA-binding NarL/FixJ family response regulator
MTRILLAEPQTLLRHSLVMLIEGLGEIKVQGVANGEEGLKKLSEQSFDVVITELQMPIMDGAEFTENVIRNFPRSHVIVLTMHDSVRYIRHMVSMGVRSYLLKSIEASELKKALDEVLEGKAYFPQNIGTALIEEVFVKPALMQPITSREREILKLIAAERTVNEIAKELYISQRTVETHKQNLYQKLNAKNLVGLIKKALEQGLISY